MRQRNRRGGFNVGTWMNRRTQRIVMGRGDGATVAAFGDRGLRGGKVGCAHVFVPGVAREF